MVLFKVPQVLRGLLSKMPMRLLFLLPLKSKHIVPSHVLVAEALALREALSQALAGSFDHIHVKGGPKILIDCLQGRCSIP